MSDYALAKGMLGRHGEAQIVSGGSTSLQNASDTRELSYSSTQPPTSGTMALNVPDAIRLQHNTDTHCLFLVSLINHQMKLFDSMHF